MYANSESPDQGCHCPLTEPLDTSEYMNLYLSILRIFKGTFFAWLVQLRVSTCLVQSFWDNTEIMFSIHRGPDKRWYPDKPFSYFSTKTCFGYSWLIVLGFNDTSTLEGHFVSSPREREKRDRRESRGDEREGQGRKRNRNESEETEEIKTFSLYPYPLQG